MTTQMNNKRRTLLVAIAFASLTACQSAPRPVETPKPMYGLITKIKAKPGQRDALASILWHAAPNMPGCESYIVAADSGDDDALWVTEVWVNAEAHKAALDRPAVKAALLAGRPLILKLGERFETRPVATLWTVPQVL